MGVKRILLLAVYSLCVQASEKLLACLKRDFLSLYAREDHKVIDLDIAANTVDLNRIVIAVSDTDGLLSRNSHLTYLDYENCQQLYFIRYPKALHPGMQSVAIYTDDISSKKPYETLYHVGKVYGDDLVMVARIEQQDIEMYYYRMPGLQPSRYDVDLEAKPILSVIGRGLLLWQHAYGTILINVNDRHARSIHLAKSNSALNSIVTAVSQSRYLNTLTWQRRDEFKTDMILLHKYDLGRISGADFTIPLVKYRNFDIGVKVGDEIVADTKGSSSALCFVDETLTLHLALWNSDASENMSIAKLKTRSSDWTQFFGCAGVTLESSFSNDHKVTAVVYTNNLILALVHMQFDNSLIQQVGALTDASEPILR